MREDSSGGAAAPCSCKPSVSTPDVSPTFVFAAGIIRAEAHSLGVRRELEHATRRLAKEGQPSEALLRDTLSRPENRYIGRRLAWIMQIEGIDSYLVVPRDQDDVLKLTEGLGGARSGLLDVVIGVQAPLAASSHAHGVRLPILLPDCIATFASDSVLQLLAQADEGQGAPEGDVASDQVAAECRATLKLILQVAHNLGARDEHRALNFLATRYPPIYLHTHSMLQTNHRLSAVTVHPSRLAFGRTVSDAIFEYTHGVTGAVVKWFARVDTTEIYPFLASPLSPYYDR